MLARLADKPKRTVVPEDPAGGSFKVGEWLVEPALDQLQRDDEKKTVEPRVMAVLTHLAGRAGEVVSADELVDTVWKGGAIGPGSIYQNIAQLRKVLGDSADNPRYITTIPRKGYRLIAPVVFGVLASDAEELKTAATGRQRLALRTLFAVLLVAAAGTGTYMFTPLFEGSEPWGRSGPVAQSIAVMPFADLSVNGENAYFCDGLSEDLLNGLSKIPDLRVAARTSSFAFRDRQVDVRDIGRQLNVRNVLEGSVRKVGRRVKITAQLIDTESGYQVWTGTFERPLGDIFNIQEEISRAAIEALKIRLAGDAEVRLAQRPTRDIDAYDLYLLGRHHWHLRTTESLHKAISYFEQAVAIDADFPLAFAGLADSYTALMYYGNLSLEEATSRAMPHIIQALKLDGQLAEAHASLGLLRKEHRDYTAADISLQHAIAVNPNYAPAHLWYGISLHEQGKLSQALASYQHALGLDPLSFFVNDRIALTLWMMGRLDQSLSYYHASIELAPDHPNAYWGLGLLELERGRLVEAIAWYERALAQDPERSEFLQQLGWIYTDLGDFAAAERIFERVIELAPDDDYRKLPRAWLFIAQDDYDGLLAFAGERLLMPPNDAGILLNGGFYQMLVGNNVGALDYYEQAIGDTGIGNDILYYSWDLHWGTSHAVWLANLYLQSDQQADAEALLDRLLANIERRRANGAVEHGTYFIQASIHALQGRTDDAFDALQKAVDLGWRRAWWAERDPTLGTLRRDPRFRELMTGVQTDLASMRLRLTQIPAAAGPASPIRQ